MNTKHIVLAGGSGFLGGLLVGHFQRAGRAVVILTRAPGAGREGVREVAWDGATRGAWAQELEGAEAVVNLAGRSVDCRYHARNRRRILDSRVDSTRVLGEAIAGCQAPPPVWLNSSTATIYRHTFGPAWGESGEIGATPAARDAFSIEVAQAWERALSGAATPTTRQVALRSAMVLGLGRNSVFPMLRRLARLGLGGPMAGGHQFVSWIHERDFCRAIELGPADSTTQPFVCCRSRLPLAVVTQTAPLASSVRERSDSNGSPASVPSTSITRGRSRFSPPPPVPAHTSPSRSSVRHLISE
jgi:uncharacterized protein (TIGR01777 family)